MIQKQNAGHGSCTRRTLILLSNEPRAYREVIAETFRSLRPEVEVLELDPELLGGSLARFTPDMVICNRATEELHGVPVWVELYLDYGSRSAVSVAGRYREVENIQLHQLLELVDEAERIAQPG